jgi:hypothetical protein
MKAITMENSSIHFDSVQDIVGFVVENTKAHGPAQILTRGFFTSDEPEFYKYIDKTTDLFFAVSTQDRNFVVFKNAVFQFY